MPRRKLTGDPVRDRLLRKGDQESELGCLANIDGDSSDAARHFDKARQYWAEANGQEYAPGRRVTCWTCVGNGLIPAVRPFKGGICEDCGGLGYRIVPLETENAV